MSDEPQHHRMIAEPGHYVLSGASLTQKVRRGEVSYAYFYVILGFALGYAWTAIQIWDGAWQQVTLAISTAVLVHLFLFNAWFQNRLLGLKSWYEGKSR